MNLFSKEMLLTSNRKVTLTVTTTPSNATCVLTYNGTSYTQKTLEVDAGSTVSYSITATNYVTQTGSWTIISDTTQTVTLEQEKRLLTIYVKDYNNSAVKADITINGTTYSNVSTKQVSVVKGTTASYSVYHSTYGTTPGTIKMDNNKTITYKTASSYEDFTWSQPKLTSNNGNSELTVSASSTRSSTTAAYRAFDSSSTSFWQPAKTETTSYLYFTTAKKIKISSIKITGTDYTSGKIQYCIENTSTWKNFSSGSWTFSSSPKTVSINSTAELNLFRIAINRSTSSETEICNIAITAKYEHLVYYWNVTIS